MSGRKIIHTVQRVLASFEFESITQEQVVDDPSQVDSVLKDMQRVQFSNDAPARRRRKEDKDAAEAAKQKALDLGGVKK